MREKEICFRYKTAQNKYIQEDEVEDVPGEDFEIIVNRLNMEAQDFLLFCHKIDTKWLQLRGWSHHRCGF